MSKPLVFISYSHKDEAKKDRLLDHLSVLQPELIDLWSDDRLGPGADWEQEISEAVSRARVAILLITANFLNSNFILRAEVPRFLERHEDKSLTVFPVIVKPCPWKQVEWLMRMNVRPKNGKPIWGDSKSVDKYLANIADEVADTIKNAKSNVGSAPTAPKILIVDDDPRYRRSIQFVFRDTDITFLEAGSVEEGERILERDKEVQIILLDLQLPKEDGTKLLVHLSGRSSNYKIIILTGHEEMLTACDAMLYNVFSYLSKGLASDSLRQAVELALQQVEREK